MGYVKLNKYSRRRFFKALLYLRVRFLPVGLRFGEDNIRNVQCAEYLNFPSLTLFKGFDIAFKSDNIIRFSVSTVTI